VKHIVRRKRLDDVEEKSAGSRSRMESDIQRCSMDIQTTRTDLQASIAGAEWRAILSTAIGTYRQHALTYRHV